MSGRVIVGFGNSMGKLNNPVLDEKYSVIERLGSKIRFTPPMIRPLRSHQLDLDHLKGMIGQKRNQALLNSFLTFAQEDETSNLLNIQEESRRKIKTID